MSLFTVLAQWPPRSKRVVNLLLSRVDLRDQNYRRGLALGLGI